jgi:uncharacterized protein
MTTSVPAPVPATAAAAAGPVAAGERIATLDVLRGFALLGILLVNMEFFSQPVYTQAFNAGIFTGPLDRAAAWLVAWLAEGKFYSLFSFLFGYGLTIQMGRAAARGASFGPLYLRRLFVLLLIGLAHAFLIWVGDILVLYATVGVLLLLFVGRRPKTILIWAAILLLVPALFSLASAGLLAVARLMPEVAAEIDRGVAMTEAGYREAAARATGVYREGGFAAITAQRARDLRFLYGFSIFVVPGILAMFLLGLYAGKRELFQRVAEHLPFWRRVLGWGLGFGLVANLAYATLSESAGRATASPAVLVGTALQVLGAPALCLGYVAALTLLLRRAAWRARLAPLAAVGRLALSNYLLQSLVCTTIFYGYGLGLFGRVGPAPGLLLAVAIYLLQLPLSVWWLRRFRFGPAEWLWRSLTYGRRQPLRATRD